MQTSDSNKEANGISLRVATIVLDEHTQFLTTSIKIVKSFIQYRFWVKLTIENKRLALE